MAPTVELADLIESLEWVSTDPAFENAAFISLETGETFWTSASNELDADLPQDLDDATRFVVVPRKAELDLGSNLALRFAAAYLPDHQVQVASYFRRPGAYARLKDLLLRVGLLEQWYVYQSAETEQALCAWARGKGLQLASIKVPDVA